MKNIRRNRLLERGSVTLSWESAAAAVLVLVGFGGVKYLTTTADCTQQKASQWVACSNVLDPSCQTVEPSCASEPPPDPDPCGNVVGKSHATAKSSGDSSDNRMVEPPDGSGSESGPPVEPDDTGGADSGGEVPVDPCV